MRGHTSGPTTAASSTPARDIDHELGNLPDGLQDLASEGSGSAGIYRLTDFEGVEEQAAISPDGTLVAFISDRDGTNDVWITRVGTNEFRNLTQGKNIPQFSPETRVMGFSPDGSQVHFTGKIDPEERERQCVERAGAGRRSAAADGRRRRARMVTGRQIVCVSAPVNPAIRCPCAKRLATRVRQLLVSAAGEHNHFPTWSPDGAFLYFLHGTSVLDSMAIWRVPAAGGTPEQLTSPRRPPRMVFPVVSRCADAGVPRRGVQGRGAHASPAGCREPQGARRAAGTGAIHVDCRQPLGQAPGGHGEHAAVQPVEHAGWRGRSRRAGRSPAHVHAWRYVAATPGRQPAVRVDQ